MLDLFCGRCGWAREFASRGWKCIVVDLVEPPELPDGCEFVRCDVLQLGAMKGRIGVRAQLVGFLDSWRIDFACASSCCEEFAVWGMRNFHPNPPHPELGIKLFNHTRSILEDCGVPYVMENVRAAQQFVGDAVNHCGPFYLWGPGVPPLLPQGITKGFKLGNGKTAAALKKSGKREELIEYRKTMDCWYSANSKKRITNTAKVATIPPELAYCVADFAERLHV